MFRGAEASHQMRYISLASPEYRHVIKIKETTPVTAEVVCNMGFKSVLRCPKCQTDFPTIWKAGTRLRAVCRRCESLLEAEAKPVEPSAAHCSEPATQPPQKLDT